MKGQWLIWNILYPDPTVQKNQIRNPNQNYIFKIKLTFQKGEAV